MIGVTNAGEDPEQYLIMRNFPMNRTVRIPCGGYYLCAAGRHRGGNTCRIILLLSVLLISVLLLTNFSLSQLTAIGLQGKSIPDIGTYNGLLFAVTDSEGVFQYRVFEPDSGWRSIGLEGKKLRSVYAHKSGPLGFAVSVGAELTRPSGDSTLIYCSFMADGQWTPSDSGLPRGEIPSIVSMDGFPDPTICGETFAAGGGSLYRRGFTEGMWKKVFGIGIGGVDVVHVDLRGDRVWIGGETAIFAPFIARSTNKGSSWNTVSPDLGGDNACNSIVVHPWAPDTVYAGMEGAVIKSTDGGASWNMTGLQGTPIYFYGLALDPYSPDHLYAGGTPAGNSFALFESINGGASWREIIPPYPLKGISKLVVDPTDGNRVYIATLGDGVWRFRSTATSLSEEPSTPRLALLQNFPNPFNPFTRINYRIPRNSQVSLRIYNLLGETIRTLVEEEQNAGSYEVEFDGSSLSSGFYLYRLTADRYTLSRKMLLIR